jgi:hypothetical protein
MSSIREIGTIGLFLVLSCKPGAEAEDRGTRTPVPPSVEASALELGAGGEVQLSNEELERLLEALERELAAASRNQ